jgi:UDP-2,3-diacylglucosamine pyrophosphatase LpxH
MGAMSDLLAIVGSAEADDELLKEIERRHPDRVTVLLEDGEDDWAGDESGSGRALRDRLATLLRAIEERTGAAVVGLAGNRDQLAGWRFDRVVGGRTPIPA